MFGLYRKIYKTGNVAMKAEKILSAAKDGDIEIVGGELKKEVRRLFGRSMVIRMVSAGSCNGCEIEINALANPIYDFERFGISIVASPRHADALIVTGPITRALKDAVLRTHEVTPDPKIVISIGDCAYDGGVYKGSYAVLDGVDKVLPVDAYIRGCPPSPIVILNGLLKALKNRKS